MKIQTQKSCLMYGWCFIKFFFKFSCNVFRLRCQKLKLDCRPRGMLRLWNRRTIRYNCASQVSNVLLFLKKEKTFKIERVKDLQQKSLLHATKLYNFLYLSSWQFSVQTKGRFRIRLINSYPVITTFSSGSGIYIFTPTQSFCSDSLVTATYPPVLSQRFFSVRKWRCSTNEQKYQRSNIGTVSMP